MIAGQTSFRLLPIPKTPPPLLKRTSLPPAASSDIYFGKKSFKLDLEETRRNLPSYGAILKKDPELREYDPIWKGLKINSLVDSFDLLPNRIKEKTGKTLLKFPHTELEALHNRGLLGIVEESSDMFFELFTLKALKKDMIPQGKELQQWTDAFFPLSKQPDGKSRREPKFKSFDEFFVEIDRKLKTRPNGTENIAQFKKLVAPNDLWKQPQAERLLQLMTVKMLLINSRESRFNPWNDTKPFLNGESKELQEKLSKHPLRRLQINLLGKLYSLFPALPASWFRTQVVSVVRTATKTPDVNYSHLMKNVYRKQFGRQEFDYATYLDDRFIDNKQRKAILKYFEAVFEGHVFMKARKYDAKTIQQQPNKPQTSSKLSS